jgi:hypothetical protein
MPTPLSPYFTLENPSTPHCTILLPPKVKTISGHAQHRQENYYTNTATLRLDRDKPPPLLDYFHGFSSLTWQLRLLIREE